jgi:hypothetical protein
MTIPCASLRSQVFALPGLPTGRDLKESAAHTPEDATRYLELAYSSANAFDTSKP